VKKACCTSAYSSRSAQVGTMLAALPPAAHAPPV